ncbi:hypothetical protein M0651_04335 [Paenibacillus sp. MBLB2552]|uniref:Uncharacterized protein n=1 Tax=Paenibacillus mellifer TaxID=2937794 RepID=A0A9X1XW27_9BACL|nr:hypothetical protein [Paenibacillus mellifer]MCK8486399.1 hypothetical protein [Paenibacillus mellifer]
MSRQPQDELELWRSYIRGSLDSITEARLDALLQRDEGAIATYTAALSSLESELPSPEDEAAYLTAIIEKLPQTIRSKERSGSRNSWTRHPLLHYVIAATLTALLLGSGLFDRFATETNQLMNQADASSLSERMMEATTGWLDGWKR